MRLLERREEHVEYARASDLPLHLIGITQTAQERRFRSPASE
jgi:hypothetical protein